MASLWVRIEDWWTGPVMRVLRDLWSVLRPMFLPLVGIAAIAVAGDPSLVRVVVLVVALAIAILLVWPNRTNLRALREAVTSRWVRAFAAILGVVALVPWIAAGENRLVDEYDWMSRGLVLIAFVLWGAVFVLRLVGFARTPARILLAVVLFAAYARYFSSLFVAGDRLPTTSDHVVWGLLLVATVGFVCGLERSGGGPGPRGGTTRRLHVLGLQAAVLAAVAFPLAGLVGLYSDPPIQRVQVRDLDERQAHELPLPPVARWIGDPQRLADEFAPVLELTDKQRWEPIDVQEYLDNAELFVRRPQPRKGRPRAPRLIQEKPLRPADLARKCPPDVKGRQCFELTVHCSAQESDESNCEHGLDPDQRREKGRVARGTAYVRVVYDDGRHDRVFGRRGDVTYGPYAEQLAAIVQYWLFYYYDDWKADTLFGQLRQVHEADWEVVTVGLSRTRPLFVALSAHCGGTWLPWGRVTIAEWRQRRWHPVVGVAEGSQANYHEPEANIPPPNWARCAKLPVDVSTLSLGYKIRDRTGVYTVLSPAHRPLVDDTTSIMRFPGHWGRHSTAQFLTAFRRPHDLQAEGLGPKSPVHQPLWYDTVLKTFCDETFQKKGGGPELRWRCPAGVRRG